MKHVLFLSALYVLTLCLTVGTAAEKTQESRQGLLLSDSGQRIGIVISASAMNAIEDYKRGYFIPATGERQAVVLGRITRVEFDVRAVGAGWIRVTDNEKSTYGVDAARPRGRRRWPVVGNGRRKPVGEAFILTVPEQPCG